MDIKSFRNQTLGQFYETRATLGPDERASKAIGYLRESREYELFLGAVPRPMGLTVRDLLSVTDPGETKLGNIAYSFPSVVAEDTVGQAARVLHDYRIRAIPSAGKANKLNVVSVKGILEDLQNSVELPMRASDVMTSNPMTIDSEASVRKARDIMTRRSFDHLPVTKDGKLHGVVTSSDILFHLVPQERAPTRGNLEARFDYQVSRIAQDPLDSVQPDMALTKVIELMLSKGSTYALVGTADKLVGIITLRDMMKPLLSPAEKKAPYYIVGLPGESFEAEAAKLKFERLGESLTKAIPSLRELRAIVKSKELGAGKRRYEVSFDAYFSGGMHAYSEGGYDLAEVFDRALPKLRRVLSSRQSKVTRSRGRTVRRGFDDAPA